MSRFFYVLLLVSFPVCLFAQENAQAKTTKPERVRGIQYAVEKDSAQLAAEAAEIQAFAGISVSADLAGATMAAFTPYGNYEAACRISLWHRYFPIVEIGLGTSNHTEESTQIHYKTNAPYFRIGADYNFSKNRRSGNRIFAGLRYGFTGYKYDVSGPTINDPTWGGSVPFDYSGVSVNAHWGEAVFGLEAKIIGILRLGWSLRYKVMLKQKNSEIGKSWYVPGYGRNKSGIFGGTFNIIFEL